MLLVGLSRSVVAVARTKYRYNEIILLDVARGIPIGLITTEERNYKRNSNRRGGDTERERRKEAVISCII